MTTINGHVATARSAQPTVEAGDSGRALVDSLLNSRIYRDFERSFSDLTGLPMALQPVETWQLPYAGKANENPLCGLMSRQSGACATCLQMRDRLCQAAASAPQTMTCALGLSESAVPVRINDRLIGFLQIGQVFRQRPSATQFEKVLKLAEQWGVRSERANVEEAYFSGKVLTRAEHDAALKLLSIFAEQLAALSNQILIRRENAEPPLIAKARAYIEDHQTEELSLAQVAKAVGMSTYYFCKMFKKVAGLNFTEYVSRVRIEKSKNLLLNPNLRISEIAYEVGFQSLTHFNRVFKKVLNQSPTDYRAQLANN